jgi:hypothetical protein
MTIQRNMNLHIETILCKSIVLPERHRLANVFQHT